MQVLFKSMNPDARDISVWAQDRVRFVMRRLSPQLSRATVQLRDVDGLRHGIDKRCTVEVVSQDGQRVVAKAQARDWKAALVLALDKCIEALKRGTAKRRARQKLPAAHLAHGE